MPHPSTLTAAAALFCAVTPLAAAQQYGGAFEIEQALYNASAGEVYGLACAAIGDVNSDGIGDLLVSAPGSDSAGLTNNGAVRLLSGADGTLIHQFEGTANFDRMGRAVVALPDINSDAIPDIAIGSLKGDGEVTLWSGADRTLIDTITAPAGAHDFGCDLAVLPDISTNGVDELLIGAENAEVLGVAAGAVYAYDLDSRTSVQTVTGSALGDTFGCAVAAIADCNTDGVADYLVSAPGADPSSLTNAGSVFLISGLDGSTLLQIDGIRAGQFLGTSVHGLDDMNGDLVPDFAIGTVRDFPSGGSGLFVGSVGIHSGSDGAELRRHWGKGNFESFGSAVIDAGDIDGDGLGDYAIGAPGDLYGGRVYVYFSSVDLLMTIMEPEGAGDEHGTAIAAMGDHDGDGELALLVTAPSADGGVANGGAAYVREFTACMTASANHVSNAVGGVVTYDLDFPDDITANPAQIYQVLISGLGTGPTDLFGVAAPLTDDGLLQDTINKSYPGLLGMPFGNLAPDGTAQFTVTFAAGSLKNLVGNTFYLSAVWYEQGRAGFILRGFARTQPITIDA